jgi:hypothetical protein
MALVATLFALAIKRTSDLLQIRQPLVDRRGDSVLREAMDFP